MTTPRIRRAFLSARTALCAAVALAAAGCGGGYGGSPQPIPVSSPAPGTAASSTPGTTASSTPAPGSTASGAASPLPSGQATGSTPAPGGSATAAPTLAPGATATPQPVTTLAPGATATPAGSTTASPATPPAATQAPVTVATATPIATNANGTPKLQHIFIVILENQAEDNTFGVQMPVPYLQKTVAGQGAFVPNYWGTSHNSLGNYLSLFAGQSATVLNQEDCPTYTQIVQTSTGTNGQVGGQGCVYPTSVMTIADQLAADKATAKGYMEDMGDDTTREAATCGQTQPTATTGVYGTGDLTQTAQAANAAKPQDQYAMRHNPWPYFMSVVGSGLCASEVKPLNDSTLATDLKSVATTANYTFVTPNLCDDGHDVPCTAAGAAGDTASTYDNENAFLTKWIPLITRSPAFLQDGLLIITFDESSPAKNANVGTDTSYDATSCCQESIEVDPNTTTPGTPPGSSYTNDGTGGGKTGTVLVSPFIKPGTLTNMSYNHYATLHYVEDQFGLGYLGFAGYPGTTPFGTDIFGTTPTRYTISL